MAAVTLVEVGMSTFLELGAFLLGVTVDTSNSLLIQGVRVCSNLIL